MAAQLTVSQGLTAAGGKGGSSDSEQQHGLANHDQESP